jgi:capsular exopolysaccharide synthesis family protein
MNIQANNIQSADNRANRRSREFDEIDDFGSEAFKLDVVKYVRMFIKWWWIPILLIGSALALAAYLTDKATPIYSATTSIEIKQKEANVLDVNQVEQIVANNEYMVTQLSLLQSFSLIERVVESMNLHSDPRFANQSLSREDRINQAASRFERKLRVNPVGRSRLIEISFEDESPVMTARAANSLAENFIAATLERRFGANATARDFVEKRLALTKSTLEDSERMLAEYADKNQILDLSSGATGIDSGSDSLAGSALFSLNEELSKAQSRRILLGQRYEQAQRSNQTEDFLSNSVFADLSAEKRKLEAEYQEKLQILKPEFPSMQELAARIEVVQSQIDIEAENIRQVVKSRYEEAQKVENNLKQRIAATKSDIRSDRNNSIDYNILLREVETNRAQYEGLLERLKELSITDGIGPNLIDVVDEARVPERPVRPDLFQALILAFVAGSILSAGLIFLLELVDNKIKDPRAMSNALRLPLMGVIPAIGSEKERLENFADPTSSTSEAYASIRTSIMANVVADAPLTLHITSTRGREGKSSVVYGLAKSFADIGKRTLIIDGDMRKPAFAWPEDKTVGLSGVLLSDKRVINEAVPTKVANLSLLPCGEKPLNPASLISSRRFAEVLADAKTSYDVVIIDSPPVLGLADAPTIGSMCDYGLFVVEYGGVRTPMAKTSIGRLRSSNVNLLGGVLNKYKSPMNQYMDYYYYSYGQNAHKYGDTTASRKKAARKPKLFQKKKRDKLDLM